MITRMTMFVLFISLSSSLCWAYEFSDVGKRLNVQEHIHFPNSDQCHETVRTALNNIGFTVEKAETYDQGPTIWGVSRDKTLKSTTKCMLNYDLVITFVIGKESNLTAVVNLNEEIKRLALSTKKDNPPKIARPGKVISPRLEKQIETDRKVVPPTDGKKTEEVNFCAEDFTQWGDFTRFSSLRKIDTPKGFLVLKAPARNAEVVKKSPNSFIEVIGYVKTDEGKFYITEYNCRRYENGDEPYWTVVLK